MRKSFALFIPIALFCLAASPGMTEVLKSVAQLRTAADSLAPVLPSIPYNYANPSFPQHFLNPGLQAIDNTPANNPVSNEGATLGRVLFYDKNLSLNKTIACASCHQDVSGFSDSLAFSEGFLGGLTGRNSMGLANARFYANGHFFWDERANTLEDQTLMPIQDHIEMGMTLDSMEVRLRGIGYYPDLFEDAFGTTEINRGRVSRALAQFVRSMVSYEAKYDAGRLAVNPAPPNTLLPNFSTLENEGLTLFFDPQGGNCAVCHTQEVFVGPEPRNNGLELVSVDSGLALVTNNPADIGKFKVPSLRNIALTGPYMHDGRFQTLEQVIDHYDNGVRAHPNLDIRLRNGPGPNSPPRRLNLSQQQKSALVAFLHTLTDTAFLYDPKWSDPFEVVATTGFDTEITQALDLQVFPNPISEQARVRFDNPMGKEYKIRFIGLDGREHGFLITRQSELQVSVSDLSPGMYIVELSGDGKRQMKKVLVR